MQITIQLTSSRIWIYGGICPRSTHHLLWVAHRKLLCFELGRAAIATAQKNTYSSTHVGYWILARRHEPHAGVGHVHHAFANGSKKEYKNKLKEVFGEFKRKRTKRCNLGPSRGCSLPGLPGIMPLGTNPCGGYIIPRPAMSGDCEAQ